MELEQLNLEQIKTLAQQQNYPGISLFMPTHRAGQDTQQNPIRFKNLLREVERRLTEVESYKPRELEAFMQQAHALLDDSDFWQHQREGLAVFFAENDFHVYRLPFTVDEQVIVAQSYYIKPVLPLFTNNGHFYLLAFSQNDVRLFEGTRYTVGEVEIPDDVPQSLAEAMRFDDPEKQLQFHTGTAPASGDGGERAGMFYGHGAGEEERKIQIERYLNELDKGVRRVLGHEGTPLVLAGVDYLLPIYRKVSEYAHIMEDGITGNPEHLRPDELHAQAWPIVEPHFRQAMETVLNEYHALKANSDRATDNLNEIVAAAFYGRVDKLILSVDAQAWGVFDAETGRVMRHRQAQSSDDNLPLTDFAAVHTLNNSGTVYALAADEMPADVPALAVLRY